MSKPLRFLTQNTPNGTISHKQYCLSDLTRLKQVKYKCVLIAMDVMVCCKLIKATLTMSNTFLNESLGIPNNFAILVTNKKANHHNSLFCVQSSCNNLLSLFVSG